MDPIPSIVAIALTRITNWLGNWVMKPKLVVVYELHPDTKLVKGSGNFRLLIKNEGYGTSQGGIVDLKIHKPGGACPGHKLFFQEHLGEIESTRSKLAGDMIKDSKPHHCRFRLHPKTFINKGDDPVEIAHLPMMAWSRQDNSAVEFDVDIEWTIKYPSVEDQCGRIKVDGSSLMKILLSVREQR